MDLVEEVLRVVERIPAGRVMSYGAVAEYLRENGLPCGPRQIGRVMALHGAAVPWYRVVAANGRLPPGHEVRARKLLAAENVEFRGEHVDMRSCGWTP